MCVPVPEKKPLEILDTILESPSEASNIEQC